jgi:2-methylcitrate dehydratase PrpD
MKECVTAKLANWAIDLRPEDLPAEVLAKAEDCIIDAIASAIPGRDTQGARRVHTVANQTYQEGNAAVWFSAERLHPTGAAFANAASASMLDIDDGHRRALGHPGAAIVPTALAAASKPCTRGRDVLAAVVAGYEACVRIGMSEHRKAYHTGNWSGFGAAVTAARLWGLNADQLMHALAVTAYHGPRVADLTLSQDMGANVKESIPWSVVAGMTAADLAVQGFSGCRDALDIEERFDPVVTLNGLGGGFLILRTYFKRYSACRWIHSAVESLLAIMRENSLSAEDIQQIRVETFLQAASLDNLADPPTLESAQYSVPYCLGVAATLGEDALVPLSADSLHHSQAVDLANKVTVRWMKEMDSDFPAQVPARVFVNTVRGNFDTLVALPWGEPDNPPDRAELVAKFHTLAAQRIPEHRASAIVAAVENLKNGPLDPLLDLLYGSDDGHI